MCTDTCTCRWRRCKHGFGGLVALAGKNLPILMSDIAQSGNHVVSNSRKESWGEYGAVHVGLSFQLESHTTTASRESEVRRGDLL